MQKNKLDVSIIIVHYNVKKELFSCISSIYKSNPKVNFEIIIVDNDEKKVIKKELLEKFEKVKYLENINNGWGGGINKGVRFAKGKYIYLLNPDTIFINNALDEIYNFAKEKNNLGVAASLLFDKNKNVYTLQGTKLSNPINAIFSLSFVNKLYPNNPISKKFWMRGWDKSKVKNVESATLSAALIRKDVLLEAGGFDEKLFLYYEEYDLCRRLKILGYKNFIVPNSKVVHLWEASTIKTGRTNEFINRSRRYYFKKYYGSIIASIVDYFLTFNRNSLVKLLIISSVLIIATLLRFNNIFTYTPFIGDQAWFYVSARDAILTGQVPLLGITSSHTWIHQGPLWTYLLIPGLIFSGFNPISGVILSAIFGVAAVIMSFVVGFKFVSFKFGIIFALLFATSPLVVFHSRFSYHTTPIPFFVLLLFFVIYKWIRGNISFFPLVLFCMSILYNFELATVIFWPVIIGYLIYGFYRKEKYAVKLLNIKIILWSLIGITVPMIPILIHDIQNGFPQTLVFLGWFFYKLLQFFGFIEKSSIDESSFSSALDFLLTKYQQLVLPLGKYISLLVLGMSFVVTIMMAKLKLLSGMGVMLCITSIGLIAYLFSGVPSEAYLVMLFPGLIFMIASLIYYVRSTLFIFVLMLGISAISISALINSNYLTINSVTLKDKIEASEKIVKLANGNSYSLVYFGPGQEFVSSVMPYEYIAWWLSEQSNPESSYLNQLIINQTENQIFIEAKEVLE